jgi:predicted PurR-regulated permease PerM
MEFIPVIGVLVSGSVCVVIALFTGWVTALIVLGYFAFVHVIEGEVVGPRIMAKAVGIHPATAIVALVAGTELFGIWGALFELRWPAWSRPSARRPGKSSGVATHAPS